MRALSAFTAVALLVALSSGCRPDRAGGSCGDDSECPSGQTCLFDLDLGTSYCTGVCASDGDCPRTQTCKRGVVEKTSVGIGQQSSFCVDRVRVCAERELCNGLDDDCNGVIDEGCAPITGCLDDAICGAYSCQAPAGQPVALCAEPNPAASTRDFERCTRGEECENGACETGLCAPLCRPRSTCAELVIDGAPRRMVCTGAVGAGGARPKHNACQIECLGRGQCLEGQDCVWRETYQGEPDHFFVCSRLDPERKPLGAACSNNLPDEGDAECQHGLCLGQVCTRICGGPGASCADVGEGFVCQLRPLYYGSLETAAFVCIRSST